MNLAWRETHSLLAKVLYTFNITLGSGLTWQDQMFR